MNNNYSLSKEKKNPSRKNAKRTIFAYQPFRRQVISLGDVN